MRKIYSIYKWDNLKPNSPHAQTRNEWLYKFGSFACYRGIWFPCSVVTNNLLGEPAYIIAQPYNGSVMTIGNYDILPVGEVAVADCDVVYTVFNTGFSIAQYINEESRLVAKTKINLEGAVDRSLHTDLITAPQKLTKAVKEAINRLWKGERFVIQVDSLDEIKKVELPNTSDLLEKLWNSNDWAKQEICEVLGISYNPSHGKKERLLVDEINGDRDLTVMNRLYVTERLSDKASEFGEQVTHISDYIQQQVNQQQLNNFKVEEEDIYG